MVDSSPEQVALAVRLERVGRDGAKTIVDDSLFRGGGLATFHAPGSHFNRIRGLGLEAAASADDLAALLGFFRERGVEAPEVETSSVSDPSAERLLRAAGFVPEVELWVLARQVAQPPDGVPWSEQPLAPGVTITRVASDDEAGLVRNIRTGYLGFHPHSGGVTEVYLDASLRAARRETSDTFDGWLDGALVGAAAADSQQGVTYFYGASTLPAARRRGVQRALMLARLARAAERGSEVIAVVGERQSPTLRNARRLGFCDLHRRIAWKKG